ncbi:hypothetical protein F5144DRAFT_651451 [Chaetomium tenue]|uniref:Uncharacterized protein n=1 Tax=Chaetomium tenue TaxID=1854479 RepID=A0ACB7PBJ0_9PEZI|nr:hypothetical protein F5144DRAFT_651451 [Chaetomium globosum]
MGLDLFILLHCQTASELPEKLQDLVANLSLANRSAGTLRQDLRKQPERLHTLILSCYLDNWRLYLSYLSARFTKINDIAMVPHAGMDDAWATAARRREFLTKATLTNSETPNLDGISYWSIDLGVNPVELDRVAERPRTARNSGNTSRQLNYPE